MFRRATAAAPERLHSCFNGKLKLDLPLATAGEMQVSRTKAKAFNAWLEGEASRHE